MRGRAAEVGAALGIDSAPGEGTVVSVRAPSPTRPAMDDGGPPIAVFVVDDHAVVRRGLWGFLDSEPDLEVVGDADGGAQALEQLDGLDAAGRGPMSCSWTCRWSRSTASSRRAGSARGTATSRSSR